MTSAEVAVFLRMFKRMVLVAPQLSWTERAMSVRDRYDLQLYDSFAHCGIYLLHGQRSDSSVAFG